MTQNINNFLVFERVKELMNLKYKEYKYFPIFVRLRRLLNIRFHDIFLSFSFCSLRVVIPHGVIQRAAEQKHNRKHNCSQWLQWTKGLFTPSDYATVTVILTGGAFEDQRCRPLTLR